MCDRTLFSDGEYSIPRERALMLGRQMSELRENWLMPRKDDAMRLRASIDCRSLCVNIVLGADRYIAV